MDYERQLIPHYSDVETIRQMLDAGVNEELFQSEEQRNIFVFARNYYIGTKMKYAVPQRVLEDEFKQYFTVNGYPDDPEPVSLSLCVQKLKDIYKRVQAQGVMMEYAKPINEDPDAGLANLIQDLSRIQMQTAEVGRRAIYGEGFDARMDAYYDRAMQTESGDLDTCPLGWPEITAETFGIRPSELAVVVGFAGRGKSWVQGKMAIEAAMAGKRTYFATLENSLEMTMHRLDCLVSGVPYREWERGELDLMQINQMKEAREKILAMDNLLIDAPKAQHERTPLELYSRAAFWGADLLVGDQLSHIWNPVQIKGNDPSLKMGDTIIQVSNLTRQFNIASVWAAQFNRESQKSRGKKGELWQIALSSEVERYVDWAFSLSATDEMEREEKSLIYILKARRSRQNIGWIMNWQLVGKTDLSVFREWSQLDI